MFIARAPGLIRYELASVCLAKIRRFPGRAAEIEARHALVDELDLRLQDPQWSELPEWKLNLAARYEFPVGDYGSLALSAGYNWQDEVFFSQFNDPAMSQGSFGLVNARVAFTSRDGHWQLAVFDTNLGDEACYTAGADWSPLGVIKHINPPRMIGAQAGIRK